MQPPRPSPVAWDTGPAPRSRLYGDVYFSADDGLAESRAVFLAGCGLPQVWEGRQRFCVAELGFGAARNVAALLELWRRTAGPDQHLAVFSVEAHPMAARDAARGLAAWPEIAEVAALLTSRWPGEARGFHRIDLPEFRATVDVAIMDASAALSVWSGAADAWFLDGFAPAVNPQMWRAELMALVARRSGPGARVASYSVASQVKNGLTDAGFVVERQPGFGRKRHRLEARLPSAVARSRTAPPRIAVIGAGIAGAGLARALASLGAPARVFDHAGPGAGASGFPAALAMPRLDAGLGPPAELFAQAMRRAARLYREVPRAVVSRGAIQLQSGPRDSARFDAIAACDLFEPGAMIRLSAEEARARLGEDVGPGLLVSEAMVLEPSRMLSSWLGDTVARCVAAIDPGSGGWRLRDREGAMLFEADVVCIAAGMASARLAAGLLLDPVRGQVSWTGAQGLPIAAVFGGYAIPFAQGVMFGATHDRGDEDARPRAGDNARNLQSLRDGLPGLGERLARAPLSARAAIRATTRDYLPLAGAVPDAARGMFVLAGLGSRGFALAPLLAEHVAALALDAPSPLPSHLATLVDPGRFASRERRRNPGVSTTRPFRAPSDQG
ncbi:MAG TPA: FAD-dependent 5-carboxymethylaminomethyl-2-thiouridine(34) oxidoreductase MnmC [Caulobacteraceae bacterium]